MRATAEIWRPVLGLDGWYEVSDLGRVRSVSRILTVQTKRGAYQRRRIGRVLRSGRKPSGHVAVSLWKEHDCRHEHVHVLVLEAFIGPRPDGCYGCHRDGRPSNNALANLYWGTPAENSADKLAHGTHRQGEQIPWARLTEADVRTIRSLRGVRPQSQIAAEYGIAQAQVSRIVHRHAWRHVA